MPRYIDVEKINFKGAERYLDENNDTLVSLGEAVQIIKSTPTADVVEVRHGQWIDDGNGVQVCSECGEEHEWQDFRAPYCDMCGAKMDKK